MSDEDEAIVVVDDSDAVDDVDDNFRFFFLLSIWGLISARLFSEICSIGLSIIKSLRPP